jgi:hypothetical protein
MLRSTISTIMWVRRATVSLVGLSVIDNRPEGVEGDHRSWDAY